MIVIVSGSRTITDCAVVYKTLERCLFDITELWHGDQVGVIVNGKMVYTVDRNSGRWAKENGIPVHTFPANWDKHGKAAGPIRNQEMADAAKAIVDGGEQVGLVTVWDGQSRGTDDCAKRFSKYHIPHFEYNQHEDVYNFYPKGKYK